MEIVNLLEFSCRRQLREWLESNHDSCRECWVVAYRKKRPSWDALSYVDIVEEALCFGWIDSTNKKMPDGRLAQRLSPRCLRGPWTQLNIDRCNSLIERGLMTTAGLAVMPK